MSTPSQVASGQALQGLVKNVYSDKGIVKLLPDEIDTLQRDCPFEQSQVIGNEYFQPLQLTTEQGFTYAAAGVSVTVNAPVTMDVQFAIVDAPQITATIGFDYNSYYKTQSVGEAAFDQIHRLKVEAMMRSARLRTENSMLYGGQFLALAASSSNSSGTIVITFTQASWADGTWAGAEGASFDFWQAGGTTKTNSNATLLVTGVNASTFAVTFTGNTTDTAAIATYVAANPNVGGVVYAGSGVTVLGDADQIGLVTQVSNTTGTIFSINAANFSQFQGNVVNVGSSPLAFSTIQDVIATLTGRGLGKEEVTLYVNPFTWANLLTDQAALRMYDSSFSTGEFDNGAETIVFHSQNGRVKVKSHILLKRGDAMIIPTKNVVRIGSTDWTWGIPGTMNGQVFIQNADTTLSIRSYQAQQVLNRKPAASAFITGIVNS